MRYIGCKTKILAEIDKLLEEKNLLVNNLSFFDAFTGTGVVAQHYKNIYEISANDNLYFASVIAEAKLNMKDLSFSKLDINPFDFFNAIDYQQSLPKGFISLNFSLDGSERMYFSVENARKIDFIRQNIESWFNDNLITYTEKCYLIASLLESVSKVSNVAGVYGAYLKQWDIRALKPMKYLPIDENPKVHKVCKTYNEDVSNLIDKIEGDIIYLDPPYTKNQYSVQYHLLETIALYDNPTLKGITGARDMSMKSSEFSKDGKVHIAFEQIIAKAKFKHIILSYSSDGIMSKDYIESVLKRYGKKDTYECRIISYSRYKNSRTQDKQNHYEYLFYIEKKNDVIYESPLNYIGGKYSLLNFLKQYIPKDIHTFYDLFGGGFNVGANINANKIIFNDINFRVKDIIQFLYECNLFEFYKYIKSSIKKHNLSKNNKESYIVYRTKYNKQNEADKKIEHLFLLIMYGFQQQIRFNSKYEFNNPVGQAGFNDNILEKIISFSNNIKNKDIEFYSQDYSYFLNKITPNDFVYLDPPYLITLGSYNDGKRGFNGWNEKEEIRLLNFIDELNNKGIRFMLSNVITHKDKHNTILEDWINRHKYKIIPFDKQVRGRNELIITNY